MGIRGHSLSLLAVLLVAAMVPVALVWIFLEEIGNRLVALKSRVNERRRQARQRRAALRWR